MTDVRSTWLALAWVALTIGIRLPLQAASLDEFRETLSQREFDRARTLLVAGRTEHPDDPEWELQEANLLAAQGQVQDALALVQSLAARHPGHLNTRLREAQFLSQLGRLSAAAASYQRLHADAPNNADTILGLGLVHLWQGRWVEAERWLTEAQQDLSVSNLAFRARLQLLIATGRTREAWTAGVERDRAEGTQDAALGLLLAGLTARIGAVETSLALASRSTTDSELLGRQIALRSQILVWAGREDEALTLLDRLPESDPTDFDRLILRADVLARADRRDEARDLYQAAVALTPERPEGWFGLARLANRDGRLVGGLALYRQVLEENPDSLEAWLGVVRTAQLLDDAETARDGLDKAVSIAPGSAFIYQEQLNRALLQGSLSEFDRALERYAQEQPIDHQVALWKLRRRAAVGDPIDADSTEALLDPFAPMANAQFLRVQGLGPEGIGDWLDNLPGLEDPDLDQYARTALGEALALLLQPTAALRVSAAGRPEHEARIRVLAHGWWAYVSTPWGHARELELDFDPQALSMWLAGEMHRRLRTLYVEADGPLWSDWLLVRAAWFERWKDRRAEASSMAALRAALTRLAEGWTHAPALSQIDAAWNASEQPLPDARTAQGIPITRARWRQARGDYAGSLAALQTLAQLRPGAAEPVQRQAEVLRASGRYRAAADLLQRLCLVAEARPALRLEYADLLRRLGRLDEAEHQLRLLDEAGIDEPELYRQRALLADAGGQPDASRDWFERGLTRHPRAADLFDPYADWLLRHRRSEVLAALLAQPTPPPWTDPDVVLAVAPLLPQERLDRLRDSPRWWFSWRWLGGERLGGRSVRLLEIEADARLADGGRREALQVLQPILEARLPDSELWLRAARLYDFQAHLEESEVAYRRSTHLGCGRLDAQILRLSREAHRNPVSASREFARRLEEAPDQQPLRVGLVHALLVAGDLSAVEHALAPLIEEDPFDPETRSLAAQLRASQGRVRQARSLYESVLRLDPLAADPRAARQSLNDADEIGAAVGYEYQFRRDTTGSSAQLEDWREGFLSGFWRRPHGHTFSLEYHWYERPPDLDHQVLAEVSLGLGRSWLGRLGGGVGLDAEFTSRWRVRGGLTRRVLDPLYFNLDAAYLRFAALDVWQVVPGAVWRWHPRGTLEGRVYLSHHRLDSGDSNESFTGLLNVGWQLGAQSLVVIQGAWGDENSAHPTADLIGNDSLESYGVYTRLGWRHRWALTPSYRFERHERFDLHVLGLSLAYSY